MLQDYTSTENGILVLTSYQLEAYMEEKGLFGN